MGEGTGWVGRGAGRGEGMGDEMGWMRGWAGRRLGDEISQTWGRTGRRDGRGAMATGRDDCGIVMVRRGGWTGEGLKID